MEQRTYYANALKSGDGFKVNIARFVSRDLSIEKGDQLKITVEKTGKKGIRRPDAFLKKNSEESSPAENLKSASVAGTQSNYVSSPEPKSLVRKIDYSELREEYANQLISVLSNPKEHRKADDLVMQTAESNDLDFQDVLRNSEVRKAYEAKKKREEYFARRDAA